jgi:hypothetical protein
MGQRRVASPVTATTDLLAADIHESEKSDGAGLRNKFLHVGQINFGSRRKKRLLSAR